MMKKLKSILFNIKNLIVYVYFVIVILNISFYFIVKQDEIDTISNKTKTSFPIYDSSGIDGYMKNINNHIIDYFPFKYEYISFSNFCKINFFKSLNAKCSVINGTSGWLFYNASIYDELGLNEYTGNNKWTNKQLVKVLQNLNTINGWCNRNNIVFELIICPNKQSVYSNYLPDIYKKNEDNRYDQLLKSYPNAMNLKKIFINHVYKSKQLLYYKTDTHWNLFGAYLACYELNKKLSNKYPLKDFEKISVKHYNIDNGLDLANMLALKDSYSDIGDSIVLLKPSTFKIPNLFIIHDSYLGTMENSLSYMFEKITKKHIFIDDFPTPEVLKAAKTNVLVIELAERYKETLIRDIHPDFYK